jgi:hypothetical protein
LTFSVIALLSFQAPSQAQVNKKLLSDVIKSCHRDMNDEYFKKMGTRIYPSSQTDWICIYRRYYYGSVIEQLPWLSSSGEILPNYLASVAVANISFPSQVSENTIIECLTKKTFSRGSECSWIWRMNDIRFDGHTQYKNYSEFYLAQEFLPYVCPKCVVIHDDSSESELGRGFINWFLSLDKSKRRDVVSFLSSGNIRQDLQNKTGMAMRAYRDALEKIEQDDKEQRRRNLLGQ